MNPKVSVCIPYSMDWPHIYFTANQAATLLVASKLSHEIIVVANNSDEQCIEDTAKLITARDFGEPHRAKLIVNDTPSNGVAANIAAQHATGEYLCFMDSHCVLHPNIFEECIKVMEADDLAGLVHAPITWTGVPHNPENFDFVPGKRCYQYRYREWDNKKPGEWYLHQHFHGTYNHAMQNPRPYQIAGCGHGFFMVRRSTWEKVGGYHPGQIAYGGREPFVTFKMWLFGFRNYTVPTTNHIHYNGRRMYHWTQDWWYENCMMQAYSTAGEKYLDIIYDKFVAKKGNAKEKLMSMRESAVEKSKSQRAFVLANQQYEFEDLFKLWDDKKVYY